MAFCVKLTYIVILLYHRAANEVAVKICTFVLQMFFVRGMQVILFYNIVYVYVCKIGEEKFGGGGGRFHGWVNPTRSSGIRTESVTAPMIQLDHCFCSGRFKR